MQIAIEVTPRTLAGSCSTNYMKDHYLIGLEQSSINQTSAVYMPLHAFGQDTEPQIAPSSSNGVSVCVNGNRS